MSDHDEIGTPAWEAAVLRRQAELDPGAAESLRRRADELDPPDSADAAGSERVEALTARLAEAFDMPVELLNMDHWHAARHAQAREFADSLRATADGLDPDSPETIATTASVFGTLRNLADTEPVLGVGVGINMCGLCEVAHGGPAPFPHADTCPWVAARQIVGAPADG
jgi:hypothetical protein